MPEVIGEMVEFPLDGRNSSGYLARPESGLPRPGIVVIQEWWGLEEHIKDIARRFSGEGFVAIAPDLYHGVATRDSAEAERLSSSLDQEQAQSEIDAAAAYMQKQGYALGDRMGVVGYCLGGGLSILSACSSPRFTAAIIYYGATPNPVDQVQNVRGPVLGLYGGEDQWVNPGIPSLVEAMQRYGKSFEHHIYPGAPHGFFNDSDPEVYRPEAAADAWRRTLDFFHTHLGR